MRYFFAISSLVVAAVLLVLGIGQRTFLAGPSEIDYRVKSNLDVPYAVIDTDELAQVPGQANIVVSGDDAFVATGASRDVAGWIASSDYAQLTVDTKSKSLKVKTGAAAEPDTSSSSSEQANAAVDVRDSDLWTERRSLGGSGGSGVEAQTLRMPVALSQENQILIASDGTAPVPAKVSLAWEQDIATPWAGPLLVGGGVFAVLGAILYLLAVDHDRRGLGPRRGRRGPLQGWRNMFGGATRSARRKSDRAAKAERRTSRALVLPALGIATVVSLTGCSASYWPGASAEPKQQVEEEGDSGAAPVPVTDVQVKRILKDVASVSTAADKNLDVKTLEKRFTGDALAQREANYKIRDAVSDYGVVPPRITAKSLGYQLVQSTEGWPRTLLATVESKAQTPANDDSGDNAKDDASKDGKATESPSLALVLTQASARENFLVSRVVALRGGISMPAAAPADEGTALLSNDLDTLAVQPGKAAGSLAAALQNGPDDASAGLFDDSIDTLLENYGLARAQKAQKASDEKDQSLKFTVEARAADTPPVALSTGAGGALVTATVLEDQIVDSGDGEYKPQATGAVKALSGLTGEQDKLVQQVAHQVLFFVPSKGDDDKVNLLGVSSELVGASNK